MLEIRGLLETFEEVANDPWSEIKKAKAQNKKIVGCVPYFVPLELVHAAGMLPVELWGGKNSTGSASGYYPAFYCSLLFSLIERAIDGSYDDLDAIIIPTTCDGLRNLEENWKFAKPEACVIDFVQPAVRTTPESHRYQIDQLRRIAKNLEEIVGHSISERSLRSSIDVYNRQRRAMRNFSLVASQHTDVITPTVRQSVFAAGRAMSVERHTELVEELTRYLDAIPKCLSSSFKVILTGIMVDSIPLLKELEKNEVAVVGDLTISESVRYQNDIPLKLDPFDSLAHLWEDIQGASVALDQDKKRGALIREIATKRDADAVIAVVIKFCEEEEFDVPVLKRQMSEFGIPFLALEVSSQDDVGGQIATRIQAFCEMVNSK